MNFFLRQLAVGFVAASALVVAGCGKPKSVAAENISTNFISTEANAAASPVKNSVAPMTIAISGTDPAPMLAQLTQVLRRFSVEHRRVPKSLDELAAAGYLSFVPAAPAGKQFVIQQKHVEVVLESH